MIEDKYFQCIRLHKKDILTEFDGDEQAIKILRIVDDMTDEDMQRLSGFIARYCSESGAFWAAIRAYMERQLDGEK